MGMGGPGMGMGGPGMGMGGPGMGMGSPGMGMGSPGMGMGSPGMGMGSPGMGALGRGGPMLTNPNQGYSMGPGNPFMQTGQVQVQRNFQKMTWSFLDNKGQFIDYDDAVCAMIEQAYSSNQPYIELSINGQNYVVNFKQPFSQYSKGGKGIEREVKRNDGSAPPILERGQAKWEWKDDNGFKEYEPKASLLIDRAWQNSQTNVIVWGNNGKAYFIDMKDRNQPFQENEITHYKRPIRRIPN